MKGMMLRMDMLRAVKPKKVFMMAGINGLKAMKINQFTAEYNALVDSVQISLPHSQLYLQSILPVAVDDKFVDNNKIQLANSIIKQIATKKRCIYVDLFSLYYKDNMLPAELTLDGVHLCPKAYQRWSDAIRPIIYQP